MGSIFARLEEKRNFQKIFLRKLRKTHYFRRFFRKFKKLCVNFFARLDEKDNLLEILRKFSSENYLKGIILAYFSKRFNKPCVNVLRVWTKNANCGKF